MSCPLAIRLLSASVAAASRAGQIIREVVEGGDLAVVQKVLLAGHGEICPMLILRFYLPLSGH